MTEWKSNVLSVVKQNLFLSSTVIHKWLMVGSESVKLAQNEMQQNGLTESLQIQAGAKRSVNDAASSKIAIEALDLPQKQVAAPGRNGKPPTQ